MWVGLIQSAEGLKRTKTDLPWARRDSASVQPLDSSCQSSLSLQPASLPSRFGVHQASSHVSQLLKTLAMEGSLGRTAKALGKGWVWCVRDRRATCGGKQWSRQCSVRNVVWDGAGAIIRSSWTKKCSESWDPMASVWKACWERSRSGETVFLDVFEIIKRCSQSTVQYCISGSLLRLGFPSSYI